MMTTMDGQPIGVDREVLLPLVREATACPSLQIENWQVTSLSQQGRRTIYRFAGTEYNGLLSKPWSLILKEISAPTSASAPDADIGYWAYWPREPLLYAAGVPQSLSGGLRSPHCYGVVQPETDVYWIWLEDLHDSYDGVWPVGRFVLAGYHLGLFNGRFLAGEPRPTAPWLHGNGLRSACDDYVAGLASLRNPEIWATPLLQRAFPTPIFDELERIAAERERFLTAADNLPQTFQHFDAWNGNLAAVEGMDGADVTVLFDWALAGYGPPGMEISTLIWVALLEFKVSIEDAVRLETEVFDAYLRGLAEAGWDVKSDQVWLAYLICSVLRFGLVPEAVERAQNEDEYEALERTYGWPIERMVNQAVDITNLLLDRAEALRRLLDTSSYSLI